MSGFGGLRRISTASCLALPLAFEAKVRNILRCPLKRPSDPLLNQFVVLRTASVAVLMTVFAIGLILGELYGDVAGETSLPWRIVKLRPLLSQRYSRCRSSTYSTAGLFETACSISGSSRTRRPTRESRHLWPCRFSSYMCPFRNRVFGSAPLNLVFRAESTALAALVLPLKAS